MQRDAALQALTHTADVLEGGFMASPGLSLSVEAEARLEQEIERLIRELGLTDAQAEAMMV